MIKPEFHKGYLATCAFLIFGMMGCATIMNGTQHELSIESNPQTAHVSIASNGIEISTGKTPFVAYLSRKNEYTVTISLDGYEDRKLSIMHRGINGWYWWNIILSPYLSGLIIDYITGSMYKMGPSNINVSLRVAYVPETGKKELFAVISAHDDHGELRTTRERMIPSTNSQTKLTTSF